jgi:hypothetical protein
MLPVGQSSYATGKGTSMFVIMAAILSAIAASASGVITRAKLGSWRRPAIDLLGLRP